jgi:hypothetical protein
MRVIRIVRVLKLFTRMEALNQLCNALAYATIPVCNAFFILVVCTEIYPILGTHYFRFRAPVFFANFKVSMFTMFQVHLYPPIKAE